MNGTNDISISLLMLDGKNWIRWRKQVESLFVFHETLEVVTDGVLALASNASKAQKTTHNEVKKNDFKAAYCIQSEVDSTNFDRISHGESMKEAWDIIVKYYEGGEKVKVFKLQTLHRQYELLSMGENEKVVEYVSKMQKLVHLMKGCGETLTDKMIVWKHMRLGLSKGKEFKIRYKLCKLSQGKRMVAPTNSKAKSTRLRARSLGRTLASSRSKIELLSPRKEEEENIERTKKIKRICSAITVRNGVTCLNIIGTGKTMDRQKDKDEGAKFARQDSDHSESMVVMDTFADNHVESKIWLLDSGCSNHMTGQKEWLADFDEWKKSKVKLADNSSVQVEGTDNIVFQMSNGGKDMIKDVLYVHGIKCNMLSIGRLVERVSQLSLKIEF
ncbi:uncharacterized protein LOC131598579 [Vicia villosa]|uniref:uncharacterized protein LOC131598579 n=1 Tax=Vicia villosa TaxID=3911 RepID=UPI00273AF185|nr:uncharacterized protein LOC131598579 [Vicia villosa]